MFEPRPHLGSILHPSPSLVPKLPGVRAPGSQHAQHYLLVRSCGVQCGCGPARRPAGSADRSGAESSKLEAQFRRALRGEFCCVLIDGEPGIGKTPRPGPGGP